CSSCPQDCGMCDGAVLDAGGGGSTHDDGGSSMGRDAGIPPLDSGVPQNDASSSGELRAVFLRPPTDCPNEGDGTAYACAAGSGAPGAWHSGDPAQASLLPGDSLYVDGDWTVTEPFFFYHPTGTADARLRVTSYNPAAPAFVHGDVGGLFYTQG